MIARVDGEPRALDVGAQGGHRPHASVTLTFRRGVVTLDVVQRIRPVAGSAPILAIGAPLWTKAEG